MSKELEAFNKVKKFKDDCCMFGSSDIEIDRELEVIETALKDYEELKYLKPYTKEDEKRKLTLEIIKNKRVNVGNFIYWLKRKPRTYKDYLQDYYQEQWYLHYKDNNDNRCKFYKLTKEEYDLLKEVLL